MANNNPSQNSVLQCPNCGNEINYSPTCPICGYIIVSNADTQNESLPSYNPPPNYLNNQPYAHNNTPYPPVQRYGQNYGYQQNPYMYPYPQPKRSVAGPVIIGIIVGFFLTVISLAAIGISELSSYGSYDDFLGDNYITPEEDSDYYPEDDYRYDSDEYESDNPFDWYNRQDEEESSDGADGFGGIFDGYGSTDEESQIIPGREKFGTFYISSAQGKIQKGSDGSTYIIYTFNVLNADASMNSISKDNFVLKGQGDFTTKPTNEADSDLGVESLKHKTIVSSEDVRIRLVFKVDENIKEYELFAESTENVSVKIGSTTLS